MRDVTRETEKLVKTGYTGVERPVRSDLPQNPGLKDSKPMIHLDIKLNFYTIWPQEHFRKKKTRLPDYEGL